MELTYRLTRKDHQRFVQLGVARVKQHANQVTGWHSKPAVVTSGVVLLGMLPLAYLLFAEFISPLGYFVAAFAYMWGALCVCLCARLTQRLFMRNWLPDSSPLLSETRLKLVSDGVEASDQTRTSKYAWQAFSDVSQSGDLMLLWLDRAQALLVPERAFANTEMRETFINTVRGRLSPAPA